MAYCQQQTYIATTASASASVTCTLSTATTTNFNNWADTNYSTTATATWAPSPIHLTLGSLKDAWHSMGYRTQYQNEQPYQQEYVNRIMGAYPYYQPESEEEKFNRDWDNILREKQRRNRELGKERANNRALELLTRNLSREQLKRFEEDKCIPVDGPSGKSYLIKPARSINIEVVGKRHKLCAGIADYNVPLYDAMLAQKLLLESDEQRFLQVANVHR